jgi:hypothetical protein
MSQKLTAGIPDTMELNANYQIQITALDPSSGAVVSGVTVSNVFIMADPIFGTAPGEEPPPPTVTPPEWINLPVEG